MMDRTPVSTDRSDRWWWMVGLVFLLVVGCLALVTINAGPGWQVDGQAVHYHLVSAVTNYPFCPPEVPCPISVTLPNQNFVVWVVWETHTFGGVETGYRRLMIISLPWA
jgi:hypothetical protein